MLQSDIDAAYRRVMDSGWFSLGPEVELAPVDCAVACPCG